MLPYLTKRHFIENMSPFQWTKLDITLHSFAKCFIFSKFFLNWGSMTTLNPIPHIQKQTFIKTVLLKRMKTIVKYLIIN